MVASPSTLPREASSFIDRALHPAAARRARLGAGLFADATSRLPFDALDTRQHRLVGCLASPARWVLCSAAAELSVPCRFYDINHKMSRRDIRYLAYEGVLGAAWQSCRVRFMGNLPSIAPRAPRETS